MSVPLFKNKAVTEKGTCNINVCYNYELMYNTTTSDDSKRIDSNG